MENKTKLEKKFAFWYRISDDALLGTKPALNQNEYENQVKRISEFDTVRLGLMFRSKTFGQSSNI